MVKLLPLILWCVSIAHGAINLRDIAGIDCTGRSDSSASLNSLLQNISEQNLSWGNCQVRTDSPIIIFGQFGFVVEGDSERPGSGIGASLFGCNGSAGAILTVNRSSHWRIAGIGIYPRGTGCTSAFSRSLDIDNSGSGGVTTTLGIIENVGLTSNIQGGQIVGYVGINLIGTSNTEHMTFRDNWIHCQNAKGSYGIRIAGWTSDGNLAQGNSIEDCYQGIRLEVGDIRIVQNYFGNNGGFSIYGIGGADIYVRQCTGGPMNILYNNSSDGGPFINSNNDQNGGCVRPWNIIGNGIGVSDISPNQYPVNIGTVSVSYNLIGNYVLLTATTTRTVLGTNAYDCVQYGPLGTLVDIGNAFAIPLNAAGWSGCPNGPDFQQGHTHN